MRIGCCRLQSGLSGLSVVQVHAQVVSFWKSWSTGLIEDTDNVVTDDYRASEPSSISHPYD